jgi:hypothetical protein
MGHQGTKKGVISLCLCVFVSLCLGVLVFLTTQRLSLLCLLAMQG